MAERVVPVKLLDDITECPICIESFNDPRSLPCIHTFCLACIRKWSGNERPGDNVDCPLCRKGFTIPASGLRDLPKNIFIGKLLAMKDTSSSESIVQSCDWCVANSKIPVDKKNKAKQFCVECDESLCEDCIDTHSKLKRCNSHQTHNIGEKNPYALNAILPTRCDKHPKEELKLFCTVCQEALCLICYATKHTGHKSAEIDEVAEEFKREFVGNLSLLGCGVERPADMLSSFRLKRQDIISQSDRIEAEICCRAEHLKSTIELHKQQLITELTEFKAEKLKEVDTMMNDTTQNKALIESLMKYTEELSKRGSNGDIAREIKLINLRVAEIKQFHECKRETTRSDTIGTFVPSGDTLDMSRNTVGRLDRAKGSLPVGKALLPRHCCTLPGDYNSIDAMISLNNQLFLTRYASMQVEVYDPSTFNLLRLIELPIDMGVRREGLVVCSVNDRLYVSDFEKSQVLKVNLSASYNSRTTRCSVATGPRGLSFNKSHNLLVACWTAGKIQEYNSSRKLVREIENVVGVRHAVELNDGTLVVSQARDDLNCVSIVSLDGKVLRRFLPTIAKISGTKRMKNPRTLAVDINGFIFVADRDNNRILVLNPELTDERTLPLAPDPRLKKPTGLWFDESRGRLYVGEDSGERRVIGFDNVYDVRTLFT